MSGKQATPISDKQEDDHPDTHNTSYSNQMTAWCLESKKELITTARNNVRKRMSKLLSVICQQPRCSNFALSESDMVAMIDGCCRDISAWNGVDIESCKQQKTLYKQYRTTATNWFNRNKAKIFGNNFFFPMIWNHLLNFVSTLDSVSDIDKMRLFTDLLLIIFAEDIHFARTKAQPLIPYQSVIQPNSFKSQCKHLLDAYGVSWDQTDIVPSKINRIYQKDKTRSKKIYDTFIQSLRNLRSLLSTATAAAAADDDDIRIRMYRVDGMHCVHRAHVHGQTTQRQQVTPNRQGQKSSSDGDVHDLYRNDSPMTVNSLNTNNTSNTSNTLSMQNLPPLPNIEMAAAAVIPSSMTSVNNILNIHSRMHNNRAQTNQFSLQSQQTTQVQSSSSFGSLPSLPSPISLPSISQMLPQQQQQTPQPSSQPVLIAENNQNLILIPLGNIQSLQDNADGGLLQALLASGCLPILIIPN
eukprot:CAMPEP_0202726818 /NCGR_PEP_ID=MMETSP1385-20130828/184806_1 /ASSEMBLY_ACC=CAM_ASM_000861 /TAXON_ID=933848 /ORGANISM="Elphidium margaritaceum" /LENGTH=468 /DNA_ID=CAMNT_0049393047 /DNA_START=47 /DNA_END=1453 /DNA_ORIENTATION=-